MLTVALGVAGCSPGGSDPSASTSTTPPPPVEIPRTEIVEAPIVEVLEAGEPPRELLRFDPEPGVAELRIVTGSTIRQEGASRRPIEIVVPDIVHRVRLTLGERDGGVAPFELEILQARLASGSGLAEADAAAIDEQLSELAGVTGSGTITTDGRLRDFDWDHLDDFDEPVRAGIEAFGVQLPGLIAPMPGAAVGPGARWRATSTVDLGGDPTDVVTVTTLTGRLGTAATYESISTTIAGARDAVPLADGSTATVLESSTLATAEGVLDLAGLLTTATIESTAEQRIRIDGDGEPLEFDQTITSRFEIEMVEADD